MPATYDGTSNGFMAQAHLAESSARTAAAALTALELASAQAADNPTMVSEIPVFNAASQQIRDGVALLNGFVSAVGKLDSPRVHSTYLRDLASGAEALFNARVLLDRFSFRSTFQ